ncbi:hypothetical protein AU468_07675 [Alkalispirochaeta sphaeroplastigenens]|uniref:DUF2225 domain-containing protein n=1 Tax=Alkalispirochaeta sphaeroplastigenens TaxID=1187066 RepID=A0A2S4JQS0_9SPIO|nr:hypothetical protein AU468_07675 [Alkalispirochaeta sphaeroplastigenens]
MADRGNNQEAVVAAESTLTFFTKKAEECPLCGEHFHREEMRTGRGRQIAGNLTRELRRNYEPSKQYGPVYPLIYPVLVCPKCFYATYPDDFTAVPDQIQGALRDETDKRLDAFKGIFDSLNFVNERGLEEGIASYVLATYCYEHFPKQFSPTFKCGMSQLRAAWLSNDLHALRPTENFDYLAKVFYRKARFYYSLAVEREQNGEEPMTAASNLGPDLDKNYGYDGALYISGLLEYQYGPTSDPEKRRLALGRAKRTVARIFGMGKASKNKPAAILDNARDVYESISRELGSANSDPESPE